MCASMRVASVAASWLINNSTTSGQIFSGCAAQDPAAFSAPRQGYVSPWRQLLHWHRTHTHKYTLNACTRIKHIRNACPKKDRHFFRFSDSSAEKISPKAILVTHRDLELVPSRASIQSSMCNWNDTLGNPRNWRVSKADTYGNSE